jgi:hypothetical protein
LERALYLFVFRIGLSEKRFTLFGPMVFVLRIVLSEKRFTLFGPML